jgi:hypothetical protein
VSNSLTEWVYLKRSNSKEGFYMSNNYLDLAYRHAPVLWQKVNDANPRGDYITLVDFAAPG